MTQRILKFRAWDKTQKIWHMSWSGLFPWGTNPKDKTKIILDILQNHFEFNQFTGLLDKNGKEIYEGDIVEHIYSKNHEDCKRVVGYYAPEFVLERDGITEHFDDYTDRHNGTSFEIIGNIYENPELLLAKPE